MRLTFCDECHKKMEHPKDFQNSIFRGNNIVFKVEIQGLGNDYCMNCIKAAIKNAVELDEYVKEIIRFNR